MHGSVAIDTRNEALESWLRGPADIRLNVFERRAFVGDNELELTKISFDILAVLLRNSGGVVETSELIRDVWGYHQPGRLGFAYTAVYRLRKELSSAGADDVIESIRGVGFRINAPPASGEATGGFSLVDAASRTLQACSTAILLQDRDRRILWANPAAAHLTGYSVDELLALPSGEALSPEAKRELRKQFWQEVLHGLEQRRSGICLRRRDGETIFVNGVWKPIYDSAGDFSYAMLELWAPIPDSDIAPATTPSMATIGRHAVEGAWEGER